VIVTMHASKLKTKTGTEHIRTRTQSLYRIVSIQELTDPKLLLELEGRLNSTLNSRHGFVCATTTKLEHLQVQN
jgi:hypothetical protein